MIVMDNEIRKKRHRIMHYFFKFNRSIIYIGKYVKYFDIAYFNIRLQYKLKY